MGDILGQKVKDALRTVQMAAPEMSESMIKAASALGVDSLKQSALRQVGSQLLMQRAKYQAALSVACKGSAPIVQREATIKVCQEGNSKHSSSEAWLGNCWKAAFHTLVR